MFLAIYYADLLNTLTIPPKPPAFVGGFAMSSPTPAKCTSNPQKTIKIAEIQE